MSLTDDWKARKLKAGAYYVRLSNGNVDVAKLSKYNRFYAICCTLDVIEVLAPIPDCDELQRLKKGWELYSHETVITKQLRQLLKECQTFFEEENPKDFTVLSERMEDLLTKINEVMK